MRFLSVAIAAAAVGAAVFAPSAAATPAAAPPPYIDHVKWAKWGDLSSLRVYPTAAGRDLSGRPGASAFGDEAWSEVLALAPDAAIPGMRDQFFCHWQFAELVEPGKVSWNLEPWRPEVSYQELVGAHCNPGGTEEPF
ncbi:DUF2599 domain-containing protein [Mycobacterium sp. Y57]|uniref:DUF2599 domain-containing protein n=1 Tax=Mycolicibacterium xanthum TaxID=2796469 RepID=UPI001C85A1D0|nr:DUF2599 domain-containing protein [Mycolicibacterium xanthum]MBX7434841.1 DUF2599 domain-containing protein [Mycolicibacterium xanthum]